jgi:hypothetical protein
MSEGFETRTESKKPIAKVSKLRSTVDAQSVQAQWLSQFQSLKNSRKPKGTEHNFLSTVLMVILANSTKCSLRQKTKRAAMSPDYMLDVLMAAMNL